MKEAVAAASDMKMVLDNYKVYGVRCLYGHVRHSSKVRSVWAHCSNREYEIGSWAIHFKVREENCAVFTRHATLLLLIKRTNPDHFF